MWHWGPRVEKIPVVGAGGLIFTIGALAIFLIGLPPLRWFLLAAWALGVLIGVLLILWHNR